MSFNTLRPNPSVERTSTGLARAATQVIVTLRGPTRFRPLTSNVRPHSTSSVPSSKMRNSVQIFTATSLILLGCLSATPAQASDEDAVRDAAASVSYVPAMPSVLPENAQDWEAAASKVIQIAGAAAKSQANATDIYYEARRAGLEPNLILAAVEVLSRFDSSATLSGNLGLMQISPEVNKKFGNPRNSLLQDKYNLRLGCAYFRVYLDREKGNIGRAMTRYLTEVSPQSTPEQTADAVLRTYTARANTLPAAAR
jgi:soluble lytic murein transglycosylase-like protein